MWYLVKDNKMGYRSEFHLQKSVFEKLHSLIHAFILI